MISVPYDKGVGPLQSSSSRQTQQYMMTLGQTTHAKEEYAGYCEECGKGFKSNLGYAIHIKKHSGEKNAFLECPECGKSFAGQSRLAVHMRSHSEVKSFICLACNKSYKHAKNLKDHKCIGYP